MSAQASAFVWKYGAKSGMRGNHLLVILAMAKRSKERAAPFMSEISAESIADEIGVTPRYVQILISQLIESGHLRLISKGSGPTPNLYSFGRLPTNYGSVLPTNPSSYIAEEPTPQRQAFKSAS